MIVYKWRQIHLNQPEGKRIGYHRTEFGKYFVRTYGNRSAFAHQRRQFGAVSCLWVRKRNSTISRIMLWCSYIHYDSGHWLLILALGIPLYNVWSLLRTHACVIVCVVSMSFIPLMIDHRYIKIWINIFSSLSNPIGKKPFPVWLAP